MIQRIQSVWLLLAGVLALLTVQFPTYSGMNTGETTFKLLNGREAGFGALFVTILVAVLAFVAIGMYKNRPMQLKLCVGGLLAEAVLFFLYYRQISHFTQGTYALASLLHPVIILLFVLAAKGIREDEKLIRESDRLR